MKNTMKKIMSIMLAAMMLLSVGVTAFAAPTSGVPIGNEYKQYSYVQEKMEGFNYKTQHFEGSVEGESGYWYYRVLSDGTVAIDDMMGYYGAGEGVNVIVPSMIDGYTVSTVDDVGSSQLHTLSITISEGITAIGLEAFRNVSTLKRVIIPTSVKSIECGAFGCTDDIELYYCGTEEQWKDIVVWNSANLQDSDTWAVKEYDWLAPLEHVSSDVKAVHFNVNPDELEDLVWEEPEKPVSSNSSLWDQFLAGASNIVFTVVSFFKKIGDMIIQIF